MSTFTEKSQEKPTPNPVPSITHMTQWWRPRSWVWGTLRSVIALELSFLHSLLVCFRAEQWECSSVLSGETAPPLHLGQTEEEGTVGKCHQAHTPSISTFYWDTSTMSSVHITSLLRNTSRLKESPYLPLMSHQFNRIPTLVHDDICHLI